MVLRRGAPPPSDSSSSDEEDAFSALARRGKKGRKNKGNVGNKSKIPAGVASSSGKEERKDDGAEKSKPDVAEKSQSDVVSSAKRHHHISSARQAKMEALLQELKADKTGTSSPGHYGPGGASGGAWVPEKKGSFVPPGEEHLTTNIFVGNLAPSVTEEEMTEAFRQFGDLYSVKIMWPRTAEERARGRNTGFVCFMTREDAQEAIDAFQDQDPLRCGRRMCLRWGKNVKKTVKRGTGGVPIPPIRKKNKEPETGQLEAVVVGTKKRKVENGLLPLHDVSNASDAMDKAQLHYPKPEKTKQSLSSNTFSPNSSQNARPSKPVAKVANVPKYDHQKHFADAIRVIMPSDPYRLKLITTVARFVSRDGSIFERKLVEKESMNPKFSFLTGDTTLPISGKLAKRLANELNERIFYRWRVYAFTQGDGFDSWRTEPFVMIEPHGRFWIPPSLDHEAARREEEAAKKKEEEIIAKMEVRRKLAEKKDFMTGRQLEHAKFGSGTGTGGEGAVTLNDYEMDQFKMLLTEKLCASREAICEAMAFCFDKSGAAKQISGILKEALLDDRPFISVDTRIARLYLLSDVLFNSQQPGVRNAFQYRDAIEAMAPDIFASLGQHEKGKAGRMTMNKLRNAVSAVLGAWTNWSVYNPAFLDELFGRFEGKEIIVSKEKPDIHDGDAKAEVDDIDATEKVPEEPKSLQGSLVKPRGGWTDSEIVKDDINGGPVGGEMDVDGEELDAGDIDMDGGPIAGKGHDGLLSGGGNVDGEPIDDDVDGEALDDDDFDGEPLEEADGV